MGVARKEYMTEEIKEEVAVATESQEQPQVETQAEQPKAEPKSQTDVNWQRANEVLKLQQQRIADLESQLTTRLTPQPVEEKDEFASLDPEDYLTVGKARLMAEKMVEKKAKEAARQIVQEYSQQQRMELGEQSARGKYQDYDYVIDTYAIPLIKNDPALAHKVQTSKNPAETAYKLGKLSDNYEESMKESQTSPKAEKILKNAQRPVSGNSLGTPLKSQADKFSGMKPGKEVWEMSQQYAKGA